MADLISLEVTSDQITQAFSQLVGRTSDFSSITRQIAQDFMTQTALNFRAQSGPDSSGTAQPWVQSKRARLTGGQTLIDHEILKNSIFPRSDSFSATVGGGVEYAAIHQFGGNAGRGRKTKLPARPFLPFGGANGEALQVEALEQVVETITNHIAKQ